MSKGKEITPASVQNIECADYQQVAEMAEVVLQVDYDVTQANKELRELKGSIKHLRESLEENAELKRQVRKKLRKLVTEV